MPGNNIESVPFARYLDSSPIKELSIYTKSLRDSGYDITKLGQGIPCNGPAEHVLAAMHESLRDCEAHEYGPIFGFEPLREAIANKIGEKFENSPYTKENVLITAGAMAACKTVFEAYLTKDKIAVVVTPNYATHFGQLKLTESKVMENKMEEIGRWNLDMDGLSKLENIDLLLITNPGNPTGINFSRTELEKLNALSIEKNFVIVSDETYGYLTYDGNVFTSMSEIDPNNPNIITIGSFSKEHRMTGSRVGYIVANNPELIKNLSRVHDANVGTVNNYAQRGALVAITSTPVDEVAREHEEYARKRKLVAESIKNIPGLAMSPQNGPEGAYYAFPKYSDDIKKTSYEFAKELLEDRKDGVLVIPGDAFGAGGEHHVRISFAPTFETVTTGMEKLYRRMVKMMDSLK